MTNGHHNTKPDAQCVGCPLIARCSNDPSFQPPFFARCEDRRRNKQAAPEGNVPAKILHIRCVKRKPIYRKRIGNKNG